VDSPAIQLLHRAKQSTMHLAGYPGVERDLAN